MTVNSRPNLRQIATELGLSVTTVSRALKDGPEVHPDTTQRVKAAAAAAGYVPNLHGRALRMGLTRTLTAILPMETRNYLSDIAKLPLIEGMTMAARERGYSLSVYSTTPEEDPQDNLSRLIQAGGADGIVITRMVSEDPRFPSCWSAAYPSSPSGEVAARSPTRMSTSSRHFQTIWLLAKGRSVCEVSEVVGFVPRWIEELIVRYNADGPSALGDLRRHNGARARVLTPLMLERLGHRLADPPDDGGVWTSKKVAAFLAGELGLVSVGVQRGWEALQALGWSLQKPRPQNPKAATREEAEAF